MKIRYLRFAGSCGLLLVLCIFASGQQTESKKRKALRITGKVVVFAINTTAKAAYETATRTGKHFVIPVSKNVILPTARAVPPLVVKGIKFTAKGVKNGVEALTGSDDKNTRDSESGDSN